MGNILDCSIHLFFEEADEHLAILENGLLRLESATTDPTSTIDELFRSAHTLKGSAALMKLATISAVSHRLEDTLEALRDKRVKPSQQKIDALLFALDQIKALMQARVEGKSEPPDILERVERLLDEADRLTADEAPARSSMVNRVQTAVPAAVPDEELYQGLKRRAEPHREDEAATLGGGAIKVGAEKLENMMNTLGEITVTKTHLVNQLHVVKRMEEEVEFAGQRLLTEVANFSERYAYTLPEQANYSDEMVGEFQELEFDRYDELNLFTRKMQEVTNDINEALHTMSTFFARFSGEVVSMDRMIVDMKEHISEARTVRAGNLFQRFTRTIREMSRQSGKEIQLIVSGGDTPIDRVVFDGLYDPLLHILRNAVSHGIESAEERARANKPASGTIWLTARRKGNTVEIEVRDDGQGIQFDKVRSRAQEKGMLQADQEATEQDLIQMIFKPGFSTSETADSTSGRGVGMNVVMDRLSSLNGTIDIETEQGQGTIMHLNLPLSLVIINVIHFKVGDQAFIIPSTLVTELLDLPVGQDDPERLELRGETVLTIDLNAQFGLARVEVPRRFAIVTQSSGTPVALLIDEIVSQEDMVIKPFGDFLKGLPHFSGSSIAGDGSLRLVVNPSRITAAETAASGRVVAASISMAPQKPMVLVVDDSLSVRKYASLMLEANGIRVLTGANGLEALDVLDENQVDFIITDLEMPLMHGYELLAELKRRGILEKIPAAVLSSRAGKQHKTKALNLGASDYLVKPFEEETLMAIVNRHTRKTH
jgi:chemosensory pili system protein ChpA (sensor histidine kinase/response regulator)